MRILHSAALLSPPSGILAQMNWEQRAVDTLDMDWRVRMYCPKNSLNQALVLHSDDEIDTRQLHSRAGRLLAWIKLRRNYHRWLLQQQDQVDVFLLRYYVHDPYQLAFVQRCKKPVYFIHHTLEVPELALPGGISGFVRSTLETVLGRFAIDKAKGVIGVTREIVDYELNRADCKKKSTYIYPNGILFKEMMFEDKRDEIVPELLFVANFAPWHGLDILLKNISKSKEPFVLHLVGEIPNEIVSLIADPRVVVHGPLNQQQILELSARCWVGLSSFALFRKKMKQACPLKVREYLMLGLPVYGDYQDVFPVDASYFRTGNGDVDDILNFAKNIRAAKKDEIAAMARKWIDKISLIKSLESYLQSETRSG